MRIKLKNTTPVKLKDRRPGEVFHVPAVDENTPADLYWRKRLAAGEVEVVTPPAPSQPAARVRSAKAPTKKD